VSQNEDTLVKKIVHGGNNKKGQRTIRDPKMSNTPALQMLKTVVDEDFKPEGSASEPDDE